ncbi:MAG: HAMP domain-containing histidine kinase [Magnetospirillum sp.]|nr:MAG: HAMP domain-containing histidine kinase [Magnetospirillum sp.]
MSSLRQKIVLAFTAVGVFVIGLSVFAGYEVWRIERVMLAEEAIARLVETVADLRRFEKNYFLYRQPADLDENRAHATRIEALLSDHAEPLATLDEGELAQHLRHRLDGYTQRMSHFALQPGEPGETMVRVEGKEVSAIAQRMADHHRDALHGATRSNRHLVLTVIVGSLLMLAAIATLLWQGVTGPLRVLQRRMDEVAAGRLERIDLPAGDAELRSLVAAFNHVMGELELRQQQMVVSQKLASLGVLLSGVAHELNNPLSNISSSCQIVLEEDDADPGFVREHLRQIDEQTERARRIVASLLDFSRHQGFMKEPVALAPLIEETLAFVRGLMEAKVSVTVAVPGDLMVAADRQRLQQVLINLIKNAAQACGSRGHITVMGRGEADAVVIEVADDGRGIAAADLDHVFDPFYTTKDVGEGSGLGLFIVHDIVKKHGGRIAVASTPGRGTSFLIRLPLGDKSMAVASN